GRPLPARRAVLSDIYDAHGEIIDQGIVVFFPGPNSYTGEDVLELQGHGGGMGMQLLVKRCLELGARLAEPGEVTKRAYLNDKLDLAQAESGADLIDATPAHAARAALGSVQGAFSERVTELSVALKELRTLVEASLDFPDEEIDLLQQADARSRLIGLRDRLAAVLLASRRGSLLREGLHVVLAGQPNVGKSSLLNRLAGEDLAIVTPIPGTTRDAIHLSLDINGMPVHVIDTAGLRDTQDLVEQHGVARTWASIERADAVLVVMDSAYGETAADSKIMNRLPFRLSCIRIMNKIDLSGVAPIIDRAGNRVTVWLSALTGAGVDLLREVLMDMAGWKGGAEEGLYMARHRHLEALEQARLHFELALPLVAQLELFAEELRLAQEALASITGRHTTEELLGEIFSRFWIGK